jgi:hypothetical protein
MNAEQKRLKQISKGDTSWRQWGTYLAERAWGTVREDYSAYGTAWNYFPHDQARSRAYRWNEDGLLGFCDDQGFLCFGLALWNGKDPILKERAFGLDNTEGNHGEDVKEYFYYLNNLPTHAYCRALYKYPQSTFPYADLVNENCARGQNAPEYELIDTGVFDENRYFDVQVEYAKNTPQDILICISVTNRGGDSARLELLPTFTFRNIWSWKRTSSRPQMKAVSDEMVRMEHHILGNYSLFCQGDAELLFTENQTNTQRLFHSPNDSPFVKDAFHEFVINGNEHAINPERCGTKMAARYTMQLEAGETQKVLLRLMAQTNDSANKSTFAQVNKDFEAIVQKRLSECAEFYDAIAGCENQDAKAVQRQALAGLLWCKQFYHYDVERWLEGDPTEPLPPEQRLHGRNSDWIHLNNHDVISMPDSWEYPWYASWDLAFHCVTMALVDADFAKNQLILFLREWYQHPNGQIPAYEWAFGDVNPPVHAWAALRVFRIERKHHGKADYDFLERIFQKLLLNFTWWVNRKDVEGRNLFQGGFLGLDNIGPFDRNEKLPDGARLDQADGTAWMAMFCLDMLSIALELAQKDPVYDDLATKFLEHFFYIAHAMNDHNLNGDSNGDLWDNQDQFYYDLLEMPGRAPQYVRVRSLVGLIPLLAVTTINKSLLEKLPGFSERLKWFLKHRRHFTESAASVEECGAEERRLFAVVDQERLRHILQRMLDENEFLSPHGIRSVSRFHLDNPYRMKLDGETHELNYEPAESQSGLFGGNSNWRGPVWMPINYLIIEALQKFDYYFGPSFTVECPVGSGNQMTLWEVASELSRRLYGIFLRDEKGHRPVYGDIQKFQDDPHWKDLLLFHEYFHGDSGQGLGASHQTGWTALVAKLIQQSGTRSATEEE